MDTSSRLQPSPIYGRVDFSWVFLEEWALFIVLSVFTLFFFNRFIGTLLSLIFRWYFWRKHKVRVKVQAVQLSLLGGRVFFKNITFMNQDQTICVSEGNFTWRYWLHRKRLSKLSVKDESDIKNTSDTIPARLILELDGLEMFLYNNTGAYDNILSAFKQNQESQHSRSQPDESVASSDDGKESIPTAPLKSSNDEIKRKHKNDTSVLITDRTAKMMFDETKKFGIMDKLFLRIFPLQLKINKGAVTVGSKNTPSVVLFHYSSASGYCDTEPSSSKFDKYKITYHMDLTHPIIEMKSNIDFRVPEMVEAAAKSRALSVALNKNNSKWKKTILLIKEIVMRIKKENIYEENMAEEINWKGLRMYLTEDDVYEDAMFANDSDFFEEYAKVSTILEAPIGSITYSYDYAGQVPLNPIPVKAHEGPEVGNGGAAPEWGVNLILQDATIHYGPWADRQRVFIHQMLYPRNCADAVPHPQLSPGDNRIYTEAKTHIQLMGDTILRVPTREPSKDKDVKEAYTENPNKSNIRPFAWVEVKAKELSSISYTSSLVAIKEGWVNSLRVDLKMPEIRTSVNHQLVFSADNQIIICDLSSPLGWNKQNNWVFDLESKNTKTFFLRDHVALISDIFTDFGSSPPAPQILFTPFTYKLNWSFTDYFIYLNINDQNIVNSPTDFEDNTFLSFQGDILVLELLAPFDRIQPVSNEITFTLTSPRFDLAVNTPSWHTLNSFLISSKVGRANDLVLKGRYTYLSSEDFSRSDSIVLDCTTSDTTLICYGFVIKYLMSVRENYFGESIHFQTLEEYSNNPSKRNKPEYTFTKSVNDTDILINVIINGGCIILPANIYSAESSLKLEFRSLDIDTRFTNYYMDLQANTTPIHGKICEQIDLDAILDSAKRGANFENLEDYDIFLESLAIHGHRMFGLPPIEPTYHCTWEFDIGDILVNIDVEKLPLLGRCDNVFRFSMPDCENALLIEETPIYDILFLNLRVNSLEVKLKLEDYSTEIKTNEIILRSNDVANERYSKRLTLGVSLIRFSILSKLDGNLSPPKTITSFSTSLEVSSFTQLRGFEHARVSQQEHVALHDSPYKRCQFLLQKDFNESEYEYLLGSKHHIHPTLPLPSALLPLRQETIETLAPELPASKFTDDDFADFSSADVNSSLLYSSDDNLSATKNIPHPYKRESNCGIYHSRDEENYDNSSFRSDEANRKGTSFSYKARKISESSSEKRTAPSYIPNPDTEYDSLIFSLGPVAGFLSPETFVALAKLSSGVQNRSWEAALDELQIDILRQIQFILTGKGTVVNLRVLCSDINLKYGNFDTDSHTAIFDDGFIQNLNHIDVVCRDFNIFATIHTDKRPQLISDYINSPDVPRTFSIHSSVANITLNIAHGAPGSKGFGAGNIHPFSMVSTGIQFWFDKSDQNVGSLEFDNMDLSVQSSEVKWLKSFVDELMLEIESTIDRIEKDPFTQEKLIKELIYQLSIASEKYGIEYDSPVLTKPAYIIRLSQQHVRANDSWKILVRLRHIFYNVPQEWHNYLHAFMKDGIWEVPRDSYHEVVEIFTKWRSWELFEIGGSYIFMHVFNQMSLADSLLSVPGSFKLNVGMIVSKIVFESVENYISVKDLDLSLLIKKIGSLKADSDIKIDVSRQSLGLVLCCGNIETNFSFECVILIEEILNYPKKKSFNDLVNQTENPDNNIASSSWFRSGFDLDVSLYMSNWLFTFDTNNFSFHLFGRDALTSGTVNKLAESVIDDISIVVSSSYDLIGAELFSNESFQRERYASYNIKETDFAFACSGHLITSSKEAMIKTSNASLQLDKSINDILCLLENIVDQDISRVERVMKQFLTQSREDCHSTESKGEGGKNIDFIVISQLLHATYKLGNFTLSALPLSTLLYVFNVDDCMLEICRPSESDCVISFAIDHQSHEIMHYLNKNNFRSMSNISLGNISLLSKVRYIDGYISADITADFKEVEIESLSSLVLLQYFTAERFKKDVRNIESSIASFKSVLIRPTGFNKTFKSNSSPVFVNFNLSLQKLAILLPVQQSSIELIFKNISIKLFNTKSLDNSSTKAVNPLSGEVSVEHVILRITKTDDAVRKDTPAVVYLHFFISLKNEYEDCIIRPSLIIQSDFMKACLSPTTTTRILEVVSFFDENIYLARNNGNILRTIPEAISTEDITSSNIIRDKLRHVKLKMRVSKLSFLWLLELEGVNNASAFHLGIENIILSSEHLYGRVQISGCYLAATKEKNLEVIANKKYNGYSSNTAYLPNITSVFILKKDEVHKCILLDVKGDKLMVTLLPSCIRMIDSITVSLEATVKLIKEKTKYFNDVMTSAPEIERVNTSGSVNKVNDDLPWLINLDACFGGGVIDLWNTSDYSVFISGSKSSLSDSRRRSITGNITHPDLSLTSPAVRCRANFVESPGNLPKALTGELLISPSSNIIHPRVLPLMVEMWKDFQELMSHAEMVSSPRDKTGIKAKSTSIGQDDSLKAIANLNINIGLRVERQEITLSCEPIARVAATISFDNFFMEISTCSDKTLGLLNCLTPKLTNFRISLQHIYSREISGYVAINDIILTIMRTKSDTEKIGILVSVKINDVSADLNLKQTQDIKIFQDIWRPVDLHSSKQIVERTESGGFVLRYHRATFKSTMPWSINVTVLNVKGKANLGQTLGQVEFSLDRFWLVSTKSSFWEQHLTLGLDKTNINSDGRMNGKLELEKVQLQTGIMWVSRTNDELMVPLVQVNFGVESLESSLSFDYNLLGFLIVKKAQLSIFNQRDKGSVMADRLAAVLDCDSINVYFTILTPSYVITLTEEIIRIKQESRIYYDAILQDSAQTPQDKDDLAAKCKKYKDSFPDLGKLRTELDVRIKSATVQVYSTKLSNDEVVRINLENTHAQFKKFTTEENKSATGLDFQLQDAVVALSSFKKQLNDDEIAAMNANEFVIHAEEAKGGVIFAVNSIDLNMETWQHTDTMFDSGDTATAVVIEYIFASSLGDIDASYNLGLYNVIREMADQLINIFNSRRLSDPLSDKKAVEKLASAQELEDKIRDPSLDSKYLYEALAPPKIAIPQLRDLGDATPPVEWIGYNRKKLPGLTHQVLIVSLERIVKEVEYSYFKVLGHS